MRVLGLALAGGLVVTVSLAAHAAPPGSNMARLATGAFPDIVQVAVVGAGIRFPDIGASWRGGWVPPHCAPNRYYGGWGAYVGGQGPYGGWRYDGGWGGSYGCWRGSDGGS
jgi:hypothetical protein